MSHAFAYELAAVMSAVEKRHPNHPEGIYAVPWYLVIGEPGSGRSTAIRSMQLTWPEGDGPLRLGVPQELCTHWMAAEAVFIEPGPSVLGPRRNPSHLKDLAAELCEKRPREPMDGILLVLSIADFIDLDERGIEAYVATIRAYLVEVAKQVKADVPVYIVVNRYDTLWGFAEVFQWTLERKGEEPWGFTLPGDTESQHSVARISEEIDGLSARFEAFCLAKLSSEDPPDHRVRAFQHLAEVRYLVDKLRAVMNGLAMANSFERAPWIRALIIGSAIPGTGDKLRAGVSRFFNMGLSAMTLPPSRPGGLPIFAFLKTVVLPERDLVPTRTRWRDDKVTVVLFVVSSILLVITILLVVIFALLA